MRTILLLAALALVLAAVGGCGDGGSAHDTITDFVDEVCVVSAPLTPTYCYTITPTATPTGYQPAKATISCLTISRTPREPCPTWTPTATPADGIILEEVCELFGPLTPTVCRTPAPFPTPRSRN